MVDTSQFQPVVVPPQVANPFQVQAQQLATQQAVANALLARGMQPHQLQMAGPIAIRPNIFSDLIAPIAEQALAKNQLKSIGQSQAQLGQQYYTSAQKAASDYAAAKQNDPQNADILASASPFGFIANEAQTAAQQQAKFKAESGPQMKDIFSALGTGNVNPSLLLPIADALDKGSPNSLFHSQPSTGQLNPQAAAMNSAPDLSAGGQQVAQALLGTPAGQNYANSQPTGQTAPTPPTAAQLPSQAVGTPAPQPGNPYIRPYAPLNVPVQQRDANGNLIVGLTQNTANGKFNAPTPGATVNVTSAFPNQTEVEAGKMALAQMQKNGATIFAEKQKQNALRTMMDTVDHGAPMGLGAPLTNFFLNVANTVGLPMSPAAQQALSSGALSQAVQAKLVLDTLATVHIGRVTQLEYNQFRQAVPNMFTSPAAMKIVANTLLKQSQNTVDGLTQWNEKTKKSFAGKVDPAFFDAAIGPTDYDSSSSMPQQGADPLAAARAAIAKGANKDAVAARLKQNGIDPGGL